VNSDERSSLVKLYADRVAEMGYDVRSLGWKSVEDQLLRFKVLADISQLAGDVVCDVGCGFGDLLPYLRERFGSVGYLGVDISEELLAVARTRHPDVRFLFADVLAESYGEKADWYLLSGALNYKLADNLRFTERMLERMLSLATKGVAANFLSTYVNYQHPRNYHHDPADVLRIAKRLTPKVALRHDYPLWEFTIYLYK
jgi:trans-aconitate methyltransferase